MPTEGDVTIGGEVQGYRPPYQRPVNTVFQNYALFPHMSVEDNVAFGLEMQKVPKSDIRQRVGDALEMVRLGGLGKRRPQQLSGGQQQRVALARALVNHPKVLLLDEPLGALDLKLRKAMQLELKALQGQVGITFIYVTHDQEEALTMSDRIGVMRGGSLLQVGSPQEVYETPSSRFVAEFIGDTNYLKGEITSLRDGRAELVVAPGMRVLAIPAPGLAPGHGQRGFRPEKVRLTSGRSSDLRWVFGDRRRLHRLQHHLHPSHRLGAGPMSRRQKEKSQGPTAVPDGASPSVGPWAPPGLRRGGFVMRPFADDRACRPAC
jgi:spermidine/putrescine transport system ATP-binding protein